jgi:hypothetical protein
LKKKENKKGRELMLSAPIFRQNLSKEDAQLDSKGKINDVYAAKPVQPVQKESTSKRTSKKVQEVNENE